MTREAAIAAAEAAFDSGAFEAALARLVGLPTESQRQGAEPDLRRYLEEAIRPILEPMGFALRIAENPRGGGPFLIAERREETGSVILSYGHGDVVPGMEGRWRDGRSPWTLDRAGDRLYGRGAADNKGQHLVNLTALDSVLKARGGRLGFTLRLVIEMGEEAGSLGLHDLFVAEREALAADVLIASDGPRLAPDRPTLFMGARGGLSFDLTVDLRAGGRHSGNWGGLIADPMIRLAHALAAITDARGALRVPEWRPDSLTPAVRAALAECPVEGFEEGWGEPGLTPSERVFGWNSFAVLAIEHGDPAAPVNAIAGRARARCQLRFVVGTDPKEILPALRRHLAREGFADVEVSDAADVAFTATRLDPDAPWARWAAASLERTTGRRPAILPNLGGSLPNEEFTDTLGMPTIWVPHSYSGCSQHAPDEHALRPILREGLAIMAGLWWDLGEGGTPPRA